MVLKELIKQFLTLGGCQHGLKRNDFNSFYFETCVAVLKELILTVSPLGRYGSLEKTEFNCVYFARVL